MGIILWPWSVWFYFTSNILSLNIMLFYLSLCNFDVLLLLLIEYYSMSRCTCQKLSASCMQYGIFFLMPGHARIHSIKSERQFSWLVFHVATISTIIEIYEKIHTKYSKILAKNLFCPIFSPFVCRTWYFTCMKELY